MTSNPHIAVVIPCYRVANHILAVIQQIGPEVSQIIVVDDCCPQKTGKLVEDTCNDKRVLVIRNSENQGVGGAVMKGYQVALGQGMEVIVKLDGDGQMVPSLIPDLVAPILDGKADYTKGNRFFDLEKVGAMPTVRLIGNAVLSLVTKISSGYWNLVDPTNGFTAIHRDVVQHLPFGKISRGYFFESDMLFQLNILRAVVMDVPMDARYGEEVSNMKIPRIIVEFPLKHTRNFSKRVFYNYYLRNMSLASIELPFGLFLLMFGVFFGVYQWAGSISSGVAASAGTVMLSALPIITGLQLILAFLGYDTNSVPTIPIQGQRRLSRLAKIDTNDV